jgi:superfamily II DNA or RNA helicase
MGFLKDIEFEPVYVDQGGTSALNGFLIPALHVATSYDRVAGYFSSASFIQTARGLSKFLARGGKIRVVTSAALMRKDIEALRSTGEMDGKFWHDLTQELAATASSYETIEEKFRADHVRAMCWLLAHDQLEIKIVVRDDESLGEVPATYQEKFHPKFGILRDELEDSVAFSGSPNETWLAWSQNIENLSTYKSWDKSLNSYVHAYSQKFDDYWNNRNLGSWICIDLPSAVSKGLLEVNEDFPDIPDLAIYEKSLGRGDSEANGRQPRGYQLSALRAWENNNRIGILEMATGTGKTFTAKLCINSSSQLGSLFTVVVAPYQHIADQWASELLERKAYQVGSAGDWRKDLQRFLFESSLGLLNNLTLVAVKDTASTEDFIRLCNEISVNFSNFLFIGDEVHWLGATTLQNALNGKANFRLGLSATPERYFDDPGTEKLRDYFGHASVFEFGLEEALNWPNPDGTLGVLTPYEYHPIFVDLNEDENEAYKSYTKSIAQKMSIKNKTPKDEEALKRYRLLRSDISKQAASKIPALHRLVRGLANGLSHTLIYCANEEQMSQAIEAVRNLGIDKPARITSNEGASKSEYFRGKSEREHILANFAAGNHEVVFAIKCLDEGVDIPSAKQAVILASSGNPKEFVQRRGRLMRKHPGKNVAVIYDMVVLPDDSESPDPLRNVELRRVFEFGSLALNKTDIETQIQAQLKGEKWTI